MLMRTSQKKVSLLFCQLLNFITFRSCFLPITNARACYPMTYLLRQFHIHISTYSYLATIYASLTCALCQCVYASSDCDQKKNTLYHNFLGNLNFKNIIIFFKRTCCTLITPSKTILRATSEPFDIFSTKISSFAEFTFYMVIHSLEPSPPPFFKGGE